MRDLTSQELELVAGGWDWVNELTDVFKGLFDRIFTTKENPAVSQETYNNFFQACFKAGGVNALTVTTGTAGAGVRVLQANGTYTQVKLTCTR